MLAIEEARGIAARLWCLPQHSHKVMDCDFAESVAQALVEASKVKVRQVERAPFQFPDE